MASGIPIKVLENVQQDPSLQIEWAGHRDIYEIVEEWTDGIFWFSNVIIGAYYLNWYFSFSLITWLVTVIIAIISLIPMWIETMKWKSEWHIITNNKNGPGGLYFKAAGILNTRIVPLNIMATLPTVDEYNNNIMYWLWKKFTNHRMQKISIKSDVGGFMLANNRMPPEFANAWFRLRGPGNTVKAEQNPWFDIEQLTRMMIQELYPKERGRQIIEGRIDEIFFK